MEYKYNALVLRVVDGDTVDLEVRIDCGFRIRTSFQDRFRLYGINAPETRGPERPEGLRSTEALREWCEGKEVVVETLKDKKGKYGRYLAILWLDGVNLNARLVEEGLAREQEY